MRDEPLLTMDNCGQEAQEDVCEASLQEVGVSSPRPYHGSLEKPPTNCQNVCEMEDAVLKTYYYSVFPLGFYQFDLIGTRTVSGTENDR